MRESIVKKRTNKILMGAALIAMVGIFASGCDKYERHRTLTFFFDGVPPLEGERGAEVKVEKQAVSEVKKKSPVSPVFVHGPKAAGECFHCHNTATTMSFSKEGKKTGSMPRLGDITPGRLVAPIKELCVQCHTSKSAQLRQAENLWVHGPLSDGTCTVCHDYHETPSQYMLLMERSIDLCSQCHADGYIMEAEHHRRGEECISCHNPHIGANRYLLRKDFNERF